MWVFFCSKIALGPNLLCPRQIYQELTNAPLFISIFAIRIIESGSMQCTVFWGKYDDDDDNDDCDDDNDDHDDHDKTTYYRLWVVSGTEKPLPESFLTLQFFICIIHYFSNIFLYFSFSICFLIISNTFSFFFLSYI